MVEISIGLKVIFCQCLSVLNDFLVTRCYLISAGMLLNECMCKWHAVRGAALVRMWNKIYHLTLKLFL